MLPDFLALRQGGCSKQRSPILWVHKTVKVGNNINACNFIALKEHTKQNTDNKTLKVAESPHTQEDLEGACLNT